MKIEVDIPNQTIGAMKEYVEGYVFGIKLKPGKDSEFMRLCIEQLCRSAERACLWEGIEECFDAEELVEMDLFEKEE